jgi:hypothetical protein
MSSPTPYAPVTISGVAPTPAFDLRTVRDSVVLTCRTTGTVSYVLEISNDERSTRSYIVIATYTADVAKRLRGAMPRFIRARMLSGSGSVEVGMGKANNVTSLSEVGMESIV